MKRIVILFFILPLMGMIAQAQTENTPRVVVIGIDGLIPDQLDEVFTPHIDALKKRGAWTHRAKAVVPTSSNQNWSSMFYGATPDKHKMFPEEYAQSPTCSGYDKAFPSLFKLVKEKYQEGDVAAFYEWRHFRKLFLKNDFDKRRNVPLLTRVNSKLAGRHIVKSDLPILTFVHLDKTDIKGHKHGYGSEKYQRAIYQCDQAVGDIVKALEKKGILDETYILVVSDHGGKDKGHGGDSPEERHIPWILAGPDVQENYLMTGEINIYDTAPTIAKLLGVKVPDCWEGKVLEEPFVQPGLMQYENKIKAVKKLLPVLDKPGNLAKANQLMYEIESLESEYKWKQKPLEQLREKISVKTREANLRNVKVGNMAPDISFPDPEGKVRSLSDLKGKVVLLQFWASWCGPCRKENPYLVSAYNKYKEKGFEIFSVSLDSQKSFERWKKAIEKDGLVWPNHVSDLNSWNSKPAREYGVESIPAIFLVDQQGKIVASMLRDVEIDAEVGKLLLK